MIGGDGPRADHFGSGGDQPALSIGFHPQCIIKAGGLGRGGLQNFVLPFGLASARKGPDKECGVERPDQQRLVRQNAPADQRQFALPHYIFNPHIKPIGTRQRAVPVHAQIQRHHRARGIQRRIGADRPGLIGQNQRRAVSSCRRVRRVR
jgi:hypothetical protein